MKIATTKEIVNCYNKHKITHKDNEKWISIDSLLELDIYKELCNKFGKANIWSKNQDEVCELVECLLRRKLKGSDDE